MKKTLLFIAQSIIVGLAIAYVVLLFMEPEEKNTIVEFKQQFSGQIDAITYPLIGVLGLSIIICHIR